MILNGKDFNSYASMEAYADALVRGFKDEGFKLASWTWKVMASKVKDSTIEIEKGDKEDKEVEV
jgi:hypothetical protein